MKLLQKTFFVMLGKGHWSKNKEIIFYTENPSRKLIRYTIYNTAIHVRDFTKCHFTIYEIGTIKKIMIF